MKLNTSKINVEIPNWLILAGALVVDSMYANHCRVKKTKLLAEGLVNDTKEEKEES